MNGKEKERWITLPNGVHCRIENGKIVDGPQSLNGKDIHDLDGTNQVAILKDTGPKTSEYKKMLEANKGDHYLTAKEFFKKTLQGKAVVAAINGEKSAVFFTGGTWREIKGGLKNDSIKGELIAHIPDIITTGKCTIEPLYHDRNDSTKEVFTFKKSVETSEGPKLVIVDVLDRNRSAPNPAAYSVTREGSSKFEYRDKKKLPANPGESPAGGVSKLASDSERLNNTIPKEYEVVNIRFADEIMKDGENNLEDILIAFDASSSRRYDTNGFLHVDLTPITKEQVVHYLGIEIPQWREHGLDPQKEYWGYRPADEIEKAASTFNGLPVMLNHHVVTPDTPAKDYQVGHTGTDALWSAPYLENSLIITDRMGIEGIENGTYRQISAAYRYDPDITAGEFNGTRYDFIIRNIKGNHVALVRKGRAGPDVIVADAEPEAFMNESNVEAVEVTAAEAIKELASLIAGVHIQDPETGEIKDMTQDEDKNAAIGRLLDVLAQYVPEESIGKLKDELTDLAYSKPTGDDDFNAKEAFKYGENVERDRIERKEEPGGKDADPMSVREAVKAGENYERRKLDREHESEGMKKAMDACGLDAESPEFQRAFAEGVKYGEEKMRTEREHLDRLHESEGARHAMDSAELVDRITRNSLEELSRRNRLAEKVMPFIGTFAFDSMTTIDVARYAARKLGLKADAGQVVTAVEAYLHNRPVPSSRAMAMDSEPGKKRINQVNKFYELR